MKRFLSSQQGFVLLVVLMLLQVITLLGLYGLAACRIENKVNHDVWTRMQLLNEIEKIHSELEGLSVEQIQPCLIPLSIDQDWSNHDISWWQSQSCAGNFQSMQYYYVIELLGNDACAHPKEVKGSIAVYYRLTLMGRKENQDTQAIVQSTFIKPESISSQCEGSPHLVSTGRQTWRVL